MTYAQWVFHYKECLKIRDRKDKRYLDTMQILENYAMYSHPNIKLQELVSDIQKRRLKATAKEKAEELTNIYEQAMTVLPKTLTVIEEKSEEKKFLPQTHVPKPRKKRKKKKDLS